MNLIIDQGNTRTKIAVFEENKMLFQQSISEIEPLKDILFLTLKNYPSIKKAIVSSVRNNSSEFDFIAENIELLNFSNELNFPIQNDYHTPETLGKDRLAAAIGVYSLFPDQNSLIIDAGTCITIDLLDENNIYQGGAILLGIHKKTEALHTFTGKLPLISLNFNLVPNVLGKTTKDSITSGVINGSLFEITGFIEYYKHFYKNLNIIITGGDADFFDKNLKLTKFVNPNLVLIGLNKTLIFNAK